MSEAEKQVLVARPAMFRNRPISFLVGLASIPICAGLGWHLRSVYAQRGVEAFQQPERILEATVASCAALAVLMFLRWWLRCLGEKIIVTNRRSIYHRGLVGRFQSEVWHRDIRNVQISQGILQRILGVGAIGVSSAGQSGIEIMICGIPDPMRVKAAIEQFR